MRVIVTTLLFMICGLAVLANGQSRQRVIHYQLPASYPPAAKAVLGEGVVKVAVDVSTSGIVTKAAAIAGHPLLRRTSEDAAKKWTFTKSNRKTHIILRFEYHICRKNERCRNRFIQPYTVRFTNGRALNRTQPTEFVDIRKELIENLNKKP